MDEVSELFQICGRALSALFGAAKGLEARQSSGGVLFLTGEPLMDFNLLLIASTPDASNFLKEGVSRAAERGLPMIVIMTAEVAESLKSRAEGLGLVREAALPLMVLREPPRSGSKPNGLEIEKVSEGIARRSVGDLISRAFGLPRAAVARVLEGTMGLPGGSEVYLAHLDDIPTSSVSITLSGDTGGIWSMATPKEFRGRGVGSALLADVILRLRDRGISRMFLLASKDGRRVYEQMGFETLCECPTWVLPRGKIPGDL